MLGDIQSALSFVALIAVLSTHAQNPGPDRQIQMTLRGEFVRGGCEIQGFYPHNLLSFDRSETTQRHEVWTGWSERCSNCTCLPGGAACRGPVCAHAYDFTQEEWCLEWSEDGCCCEKMGCRVDEQNFTLGQQMPYDSENPCLTCTCHIGWSKQQCLMQKCNKVELQCQNRATSYDAETCCPTYTCPEGVKCETIPDPFPNTTRHELLDWYGGHIAPIQQGMTQHFHMDSWTSYVCSCPSGGTAACEMKTFGK